MVDLPAVIGIVLLSGTATVSLLGVGYVAGRWQATPAAGSMADRGPALWIDDREGLARELVALVELGASTHREFEWLATVTARHTYRLPPDVRVAVQRTGEAVNRWWCAAQTIERRTTLRLAVERQDQVRFAQRRSQRVRNNVDGNHRQEFPESLLSSSELRHTLEAEPQADQKSHVYDCMQLLAPCDDGLPRHEELVSVRCRELSTRGVSFLWPDRPAFENALISLGHGPRLTFMRAKVKESRCIAVDGELQYLVRCHFMGRASEFTAEWHVRHELHKAAQLAPHGSDGSDGS